MIAKRLATFCCPPGMPSNRPYNHRRRQRRLHENSARCRAFLVPRRAARGAPASSGAGRDRPPSFLARRRRTRRRWAVVLLGRLRRLAPCAFFVGALCRLAAPLEFDALLPGGWPETRNVWRARYGPEMLDEFVAQASTNAAATMAQEMPRLAKRANEQREAAQFHKKACRPLLASVSMPLASRAVRLYPRHTTPRRPR